MDHETLSYADEFLGTELGRTQVREWLVVYYGAGPEMVDAVLAVLDGEGFFDGQ